MPQRASVATVRRNRRISDGRTIAAVPNPTMIAIWTTLDTYPLEANALERVADPGERANRRRRGRRVLLAAPQRGANESPQLPDDLLLRLVRPARVARAEHEVLDRDDDDLRLHHGSAD